MPLKNPPHPGETVLQEILAPHHLTITEAAEILGVRRATLSDLCHGKAALSPEMALRLHKAFGVSLPLLINLQAAYDIARMSDPETYNAVRVTAFDQLRNQRRRKVYRAEEMPDDLVADLDCAIAEMEHRIIKSDPD